MGKSVQALVEDALTLHKQAGRLKKAGFTTQADKIDKVANQRLASGIKVGRRRPRDAGGGELKRR